MGSGGVAIAALPTVICLKVPFSDGLGGVEAKHSFSPELSTFAAVLQESIQVCLIDIQGKIDKDEKIDYEE